jgi:hypothetical protein
MSIILRFIVIMACAYAGSAVAAMQFSDMPDLHQMAAQK